MSGLTTHVLDLSLGRPAADVVVRLSSPDSGAWRVLSETRTDQDGRARLCDPVALAVGHYRLEFDVGLYFRAVRTATAAPAFLETVVIDFNVTEAEAAYHVPLLVSPFGYSTYRGS